MKKKKVIKSLRTTECYYSISKEVMMLGIQGIQLNQYHKFHSDSHREAQSTASSSPHRRTEMRCDTITLTKVDREPLLESPDTLPPKNHLYADSY